MLLVREQHQHLASKKTLLKKFHALIWLIWPNIVFITMTFYLCYL